MSQNTHGHFMDDASEGMSAHDLNTISSRVEAAGRDLARWGLVIICAWIGLMKFTKYEATGISLYVAHSPLMSWAFHVMSVRQFSAVLGVTEVGVAILIAARRFSPRASAIGGFIGVGMFLTTLSFLFTTPGIWETSEGGFPALSGFPGQFVIKDIGLLGISLWVFGESWKASLQQSQQRN
jgi:reactive chlorine resistance protein C